MRLLLMALPFAAISVLACGSSQAPLKGGGPTPATLRVEGPGGGAITLVSNEAATRTILAFPIARVWRILPSAYDSLGLPIAILDPDNHIIANGDTKLRRQLGGVPLRTYLDCGGVQIGSSADSYEIVLTVQTQLQADESGATTVMTLVQAVGKPIAFAQDYSRCGSTGNLETRLADVIRFKLLQQK